MLEPNVKGNTLSIEITPKPTNGFSVEVKLLTKKTETKIEFNQKTTIKNRLH
jgi:hypothetical protein